MRKIGLEFESVVWDNGWKLLQLEVKRWMKLIIEEPQNLLRWTSQTAWFYGFRFLLCSDKWDVLLVYIYSGCYLVMLVYCSNIRVFELRQTSCEIIYEWVFHFYLVRVMENHDNHNSELMFIIELNTFHIRDYYVT